MTEPMTRSLLAAAELVDDLAAQRRREEQAFRDGYGYGFAAGEQVGAQRAERELTARWAAAADHVHTVAGRPAHADLEARRAEPGGPAYFAALMRHGGTEFAGVGRPRVPASAGAYRRALEWAEQRRENAA